MADLTLRERRSDDLPTLWHWLHAEADAEWKRWDGPYFHSLKAPSILTLGEYTAQVTPAHQDTRIIALDDLCIGTVSRHEESPAGAGWWELGIVIYSPQHWGLGLGGQALGLWTDTTFREAGAHLLTLTTWSGNERMVRSGVRQGYRECAQIPEARLWQGRRYDSVKLALLRQDWDAPNSSPTHGGNPASPL